MRMLLTLFIGTLGGVGAFYLHLPIPWLLGSLLLVCFVQSTGLRLQRPSKKLERLMRVLIGVTLGAGVASNASLFSVELWAIVAIVFIFVVFLCLLGTYYFSRLNGFSHSDGFMSSLPGGLSFLLALSGDLGERFPKIALVHTVRVVVLVMAFSLFALILEANTPNKTMSDAFAFSSAGIGYLLVLVVVSWWLAQTIKIAGGHLLFSLVLASLAYQQAWVVTPMPELGVTLAMITFGSLLGYELSKNPEPSTTKVAWSSMLFTVLSLLLALAVALLLGEYFDKGYLLFLLALAPGGIAEISLIAIALGVDAGFVATVHACRFAFIMIIGPIGMRLAKM